jgi:diguanylate cyclase (GGDEF)-like protein
MLDVMTSYAICGAGALVGASMLTLADSPRAEVVRALRLCQAGLVVLGFSLLVISLHGQTPGPLSQLVGAVGALLAVVLSAWGLGMLVGQRTPPLLLAGLVVASVLVPAACISWSPTTLPLAVALGLAAASLHALYNVRSALLAPADVPTRAIGISIFTLAVVNLLRAAWTLDYTGPMLPHLLHVPVWVQPIFVMFYGVLPTAISTLLLLVVNGQLHQQLQMRATTDELTGVLTRRALREQAPEHIHHAQRGRQALAVLMLDLDHFKAVNDQHGHAVGDVVLRQSAGVLRDALRPDCLLARYGGEEFVALVPVADVQTARLVAERLRQAVAAKPWATPAGTLNHSTISVGATLVSADESLDEALQRADEALYRAKREGRNRVQMGLMAA